MAAEEHTPTPVRSALLRGHHRHGRRAGTSGGVHRGLPDRQHGQRLGQAGQLAGRPTATAVVVLDARATVLVHAPLVHGACTAGRQTHDRSQTRSSRPNVHRYNTEIYNFVQLCFKVNRFITSVEYSLSGARLCPRQY